MNIHAGSGIYQITCVATGARYIGSAVKISRRFQQHQADAKKGNHANIHFQRSWDKYGEGAFVFTVVALVRDVEKLVELEQQWIDRLRPELNICRVAGSVLGLKHTPATLAKMSMATRGRRLTAEHKAKVSAALKGRETSEQTREKLSIGNSGKKRTAEQNARNSEARVGVPLAEETKRKLSAALTGRRKSEETKRKLSIAHLGTKRPPLTDEHKRRIADGVRAARNNFQPA